MMARRRNWQKWGYLGLICLVLALMGVGGYLVWQHGNEEEKNEQSLVDGLTESKQQKEERNQEEPKDSKNEIEEKAAEEAERQKVVQYEGDDPNTAEALSGVITYAGVNSGNLMIRMNIDQFLDDGVCRLTIRQAGANIYQAEARVVGNVATATCEGFDVPVAQLEKGSVQIVINVSANGKTGIIEGEATI